MRRNPRIKTIPLSIGNDPDLWKYDSLHSAIADSTDVLSQLIRSVEDSEEAMESTDSAVSNGNKVKEA